MIRVFLVFIFCICSIAAHAQVSADVVEKFAGAETYPAAARAVRATGKVVVVVTIDANGEVVYANTVSGHPLLRNVSQQAALKWRFSRDFAATTREIELTFNYQIGQTKAIEKSEKEAQSEARNVYAPPFQVEVFGDTLVPKFLLLPREYGEIKPAVCEIHNLPMQVEIAESAGRGTLPEDALENFYEIREEIFPNANIAAYVNFPDGIEKREIHFCDICRAKREEWLKENL